MYVNLRQNKFPYIPFFLFLIYIYIYCPDFCNQYNTRNYDTKNLRESQDSWLPWKIQIK